MFFFYYPFSRGSRKTLCFSKILREGPKFFFSGNGGPSQAPFFFIPPYNKYSYFNAPGKCLFCNFANYVNIFALFCFLCLKNRNIEESVNYLLPSSCNDGGKKTRPKNKA